MATNGTGSPASRVQGRVSRIMEELVVLLRTSLHNLIGKAPEEYEAGRFLIEVDDLEITVVTSEDTFPAIRFGHRVMEIPPELRVETIRFANALHGRSSTLGAHWWLGDESLWQVGILWAGHFHEEVFRDHLSTFINIAFERTPEIRSRLGTSC